MLSSPHGKLQNPFVIVHKEQVTDCFIDLEFPANKASRKATSDRSNTSRTQALCSLCPRSNSISVFLLSLTPNCPGPRTAFIRRSSPLLLDRGRVPSEMAESWYVITNRRCPAPHPENIRLDHAATFSARICIIRSHQLNFPNCF